jgi:protein TonB
MSSQICLTMPSIQSPDDLSLRDRSFVVAVVVLVHVLLLWFYNSSSGLPSPGPREMSISMAMPIQQTTAVQQKPQERQKPKLEPQVAPPDVPVEAPAPSPPVESASAQPENVTPSVDTEPDYHAAYLNNPLPGYPMVARRMGWQGKVVLYVEVLESGMPGQIKLHQSSGRDVLDNAAMQAVRGWRFVPARKNGQVVAKWFLVPIPFILKEAE